MSNLQRNDLEEPLPFFYLNILVSMIKKYDRNYTSVVDINYNTSHASKLCCNAGSSMYFTKITSRYSKANVCFYHTRKLRGKKYSFGCVEIIFATPEVPLVGSTALLLNLFNFIIVCKSKNTVEGS